MSATRRPKAAPAAFAAAIAVCCALACAFALAADTPKPSAPYWHIEIAIAFAGDYDVRSDGVDVPGQYAYKGTWTGAVQKDGLDVLIVHTASRRLEWRLTEHPPHAPAVTERDVPDRPVFHMNYIIRRNEALDIDMDVDGLAVPVAGPDGRVPLVLPCSAENADRRAGLDYNATVTKGSNAVRLEPGDLGGKPVVRKFAWTWQAKHRDTGGRGPVVVASSHRVEAIVSVTPAR